MNRNTRRLGRGAPPGARSSFEAVLPCALLGLCGIALGGCERSFLPPEDPAEPRLVRFVRPLTGDSVGGVQRVRASVRDPDRTRLVFSVEGEPVDTLWPPYWKTDWSVGNSDPARWRRIALSGAAGETLDAVTVRVVPDLPPTLTIRTPRKSRWMERTATSVLWAEGTDPEDGPIRGASIFWSGSALRRTFRGDSLPLVLLSEDEQEVAATAFDHRGGRGEARIGVRPFRYLTADQPTAATENLLIAMRARDALRLRETLDERFEFLPCDGEASAAGWPRRWQRAPFTSALAAWLEAPSRDWLEVEADVRLQALWRDVDTTLAWVIASPLRVSTLPSDPDSASTSYVGAAGLLLRRVDGGSWSVRSWREGSSDRTESLASQLAPLLGWPRSPLRGGCRRLEAPIAPGWDPGDFPPGNQPAAP